MQNTKSKTPRLKYLLLAAVLALFVSGCGGGSAELSETTRSAVREETAAETTITETTVTETVTVTEETFISLAQPSDDQPAEETERVTFPVHGTNRKVDLPEGTLVWIPETGEKFHIQNKCGNMNPDKAKQITVEEAKALGYEAGSKCY